MTPAMFWRHRYQDEVDRQESGQTKPPDNNGRFRLKKLGVELRSWITSNPSSLVRKPRLKSECSPKGRGSAFQAEFSGFDPRHSVRSLLSTRLQRLHLLNG